MTRSTYPAGISLLVACGIALSSVAGCADGSKPQAAGSVGSPTPAPSQSVSSSQTPPPSALRTGPPQEPTDLIRPATVRGVVASGTPAECRVLVADNTRYVLVGEPANDVRAGERLEVLGRAAPQLRSSCDGTVFRVYTLRRL
ncbi:MAG: hypothetical protein WCB04_00835 [Mycobacteriales bacterium]